MPDQDDLFAQMSADGSAGLGHKSEPVKPKEEEHDFLFDPNDDWYKRAVAFNLPDYPVKGEPMIHQRLALGEAGLKKAHAYWIDAGGGKTFVTIAEACLLHQRDEIDGMIVIAPNGPHRQWVLGEMPKWAGVPWHGTYTGAHKTSQHGEKAPQNAFLDSGRVDKLGIIAINVEGVSAAEARRLLGVFVAKYPRFMLVLDESQKAKSPEAARTREINVLARQAIYVRTLSGTPLLKGIEDLIPQYYILKPGITGPFETSTLSKNFIAARNYYTVRVSMNPRNDPRIRAKKWHKKVVGYRNEAVLRARVRPYSTRITEDMFMGDREGAITIPQPVEMTREQSTLYNSMKQQLLAEIDGNIITASSALTQMAKLRQLASGFIYDEDRNVTWVSEAKINATLDLLEDISGSTLVWAPDIPMLDKLQERLSEELERPVYRYAGKPEIVDDWKKTGGVMIGNQGSGLGVGMNLQHAATNIYVANSFSAEARWQSLKRTNRIGQTLLVRNWDLLSVGTIDYKALDNLDAKAELSRLNIDALREVIAA